MDKDYQADRHQDRPNPRLELVKTRLEKIDAKTIDRNRQQGEKLRLSTDWNYQIRKKTAEYAVISATCRTWFIPEGLFEIFTEFTVVYRCKDDIAQNELEKSMEKLLLPAGEQNALLVAQITDKMRGNPMVVSPKVTLQDKGMNLN